MRPVSIVTVTGAGGGVSFDGGASAHPNANAVAGAEPVVVGADGDAELGGLADGHRLGIGV